MNKNIAAAERALERIKERSRSLADTGQLPTQAEIQIMQLNTQGAIALLLVEIAKSLEDK